MGSEAPTCRVCGSSSLVEGRIDDATFKMKVARTRFLLSDCITMQATACLDCGNVAIHVDPAKVRSKLGD